MINALRATSSVAAVLLVAAAASPRQYVPPVVNPPNPSTNITISMGDYLTPGVTPAQAFDLAVAAARQQHAARLTIPPGSYRFTGTRDGFHLTLSNLSDITVDGQGAEFVFTAAASGIGVFDSHRIVVRNLTVDYDLVIASLGVAHREADGSTTIRVRDDFPITAGTPVHAVTRFDHEALRWAKAWPESCNPPASR